MHRHLTNEHACANGCRCRCHRTKCYGAYWTIVLHHCACPFLCPWPAALFLGAAIRAKHAMPTRRGTRLRHTPCLWLATLPMSTAVLPLLAGRRRLALRP